MLNDSIYAIEPNDHAIYLDVKQYLANQRQGTHKAKERAEIAGSTRKIKKQKGTGTARAGSIKSPVFKGGGVITSYSIHYTKLYDCRKPGIPVSIPSLSGGIPCAIYPNGIGQAT